MPRVDLRGARGHAGDVIDPIATTRIALAAEKTQHAVMATNKNPTTFTGDVKFRKGACHGALWFLQTVRRLSSEGRSAEEISEHLRDLLGVMTEWRSGAGELPDGNPWDWSYKDLASVIKARHEE